MCAWYIRSQTKQEIAPPSHVVERYIELLCRYQPEAVYNFLRINDNYRLEEALEVSVFNLITSLLNESRKISFIEHRYKTKNCMVIIPFQVCSKARLNDATSYLLERSGDAMGAFKLILEVS